jgi:hypothetical protein
MKKISCLLILLFCIPGFAQEIVKPNHPVYVKESTSTTYYAHNNNLHLGVAQILAYVGKAQEFGLNYQIQAALGRGVAVESGVTGNVIGQSVGAVSMAPASGGFLHSVKKVELDFSSSGDSRPEFIIVSHDDVCGPNGEAIHFTYNRSPATPGALDIGSVLRSMVPGNLGVPVYGYYLVDLDSGSAGSQRSSVRSIEQFGQGRCTSIFALSWPQQVIRSFRR